MSLIKGEEENTGRETDIRRGRMFAHLDSRVAPPQRYTWGRSPITVSGWTGICFDAALVPNRKKEDVWMKKVPPPRCTGTSLQRKAKDKEKLRCAVITKGTKTQLANTENENNANKKWTGACPAERCRELLRSFPAGPRIDHSLNSYSEVTDGVTQVWQAFK